ncbi:MAG TPA: CopD family protein [Steroidobacteraceae bacterium]|nr:CopD family protein [Steroidobacteraceae bacterium]
MIDGVSVILRALGFIAIFQAAGMAVFLALFQRGLAAATIAALRRTGLATALAALILVAGHFVLEPARLGGELGAIADSGLRDIVLDSPLASAFAWRASGLILLVIGFSPPAHLERFVTLAGTTLVLFAFTQAGHTTTHSPQWLLGALLFIHIAAVAFWFGSLLPLRRIAVQEPSQTVGRIVEAFSRLAVKIVPLLATAGLALAILLLGNWSNLATPYGGLLLLKIGLFSILMLLAALNRWRYGPALKSGAPRAAAAFNATVVAEIILIGAALASTAVLTAFYSPAD